jgi:SAM-dependent methyltransferase
MVAVEVQLSGPSSLSYLEVSGGGSPQFTSQRRETMPRCAMTDRPSSPASQSKAGSATVGARGVRVPAGVALDVLFDDQRIWSTGASPRASDGRARDDGLCLVPWPPALRPYLNGITRVTVRDYLTHEVLVDEELAFGSEQERVRVVDPSGLPLALDKWGDLVRPFDCVDGGTIEATLEQTADVLAALREECGVPAFVTYGTLLGAVRDGDLIGHDNDIDVAYLSAHYHPADIARESFQIQHELCRRGWRVQRISGGFVQVGSEGREPGVPHVDVFAAFHALGRFYQVFAVEAALPRSAILPLGEVTLHGRRLPAPADPEALLQATYGPSWRVPDPAFEFNAPEETRRRIGGRGGWLGGYHARRSYWKELYSSDRDALVPDKPTAFAHWVGEREAASTSLVDIGCGTGRDALWFASSGHRVLGLDFVPAAVARARAKAKAEGLTASFEYLDLGDLRQVLAMGARFAHARHPHVLYGRFLLHALEDPGRHNLWRLARMALRSGGRLYLEFRTRKDAHQRHAFGEHFRRFLRPSAVVDEIESSGGQIEHREEGHGLAVYRDEDPHVCRLVARWWR